MTCIRCETCFEAYMQERGWSDWPPEMEELP